MGRAVVLLLLPPVLWFMAALRTNNALFLGCYKVCLTL